MAKREKADAAERIACVHKAWIICGVFRATPTRGPLGPFPMFSSIGRFLPFFRTQEAAREYCRDRGMKVPGAFGIHFRRVIVSSRAAIAADRRNRKRRKNA